jgi:hypothetical protein
LLAYAVGALDPGRAADVETAGVAPLVVPATPPLPLWRLPPPGRVSGRVPFGAEARPALVMGGPLREGDRVEVALRAPADHAIAVLSDAGEWTVVFPGRAAEKLTVGDLPERDGAYILELALRPGAGEQRYAVALLPPTFDVDWDQRSERRWAALPPAIEAGEVSVITLAFQVSAAPDRP